MNTVANDKYSSSARLLCKIVNDECLMLNGKIKDECKFNINNPKLKIQNSKLIGKSEDKFETMLFLPEGERRKGEGGLRTKGYFKFSYVLHENRWWVADLEGNPVMSAPDDIQEKINSYLNNPKSNIQNPTSLKNLPLITVITVVFNGEKYLEQTILSVINQTYPNVEYIIIDGGSTDGTLDIIKKYENYIDYWVSEKDKGISDAFNKGIISSLGKYINFLNAGDYYTNNSIINLFLDLFIKNSAIITAYARFRNITLPRKILKNNDFLFKKARLSHQASFINFRIFKELGLYSKKYKVRMDYEFWIRVLRKYNFVFINKIIIYYDENGISGKDLLKSYSEEININYKYLPLMQFLLRSFEIFISLILKKVIK
jgi:GT2 family glycosyltransferase